MKKIKQKEFELIRENALENKILYDICTKYPLICDEKQLSAKSFLIGRSYAASPQRGVKNKKEGMNFDFFTEYAKKLISNLSIPNFDQHMRELSSRDLSSINDLYEALKVVISFNDASYEAIKDSGGKNTISFSSKILHFHLPNIVFIMDSYARKNARAVVEDDEIVKENYKRLKEKLLKDNMYQKKYIDLVKHYIRCYYIRRHAGEGEYILSTRDVDNYLIKKLYKDSSYLK